MLHLGKLAPNVQVTNGSGLFLEIILRSDKLRNQGRGELLISLCHQVAFLKKILLETFNSESVGYSDAVVQPGASRITVVVLKARNLPKMDITGLSGDTVQVFPTLCYVRGISSYPGPGLRIFVKIESFT